MQLSVQSDTQTFTAGLINTGMSLMIGQRVGFKEQYRRAKDKAAKA